MEAGSPHTQYAAYRLSSTNFLACICMLYQRYLVFVFVSHTYHWASYGYSQANVLPVSSFCMCVYVYEAPVLKIDAHGAHVRGTKQVWGDQRAGGPENLLALRAEGTRALS